MSETDATGGNAKMRGGGRGGVHARGVLGGIAAAV